MFEKPFVISILAACALGFGLLGSGCSDDDNQNNNTAECGDGVIEGVEVCDGSAVGAETCQSQGFTSGTLSCNATCDAYNTSQCLSTNCGDGNIETGEVCDGVNLDGNDCTTLGQGFTGGTLACGATCTAFDTSACFTCGNDTTETGEVCDGQDVNEHTCQDEGFLGGTMACADTCDAYDVTGCTASICNNGTIEGAEICDGSEVNSLDCTDLGYTGGTLSCNATCSGYDTSQCTGQVAATAFRISEMYLRDPHVYAPIVCQDVTDTELYGFSANGAMNDAIQLDSDADGFLDLSVLALFRPLDQTVPGGAGIDFASGACTEPMVSTSCALPASPPPETTFYTNQSTGACLQPDPTNLSPASYTPPVTSPTDDCFHTGQVSMILDFMGTAVTLQNVTVAAEYSGTPATTLVDGLLIGFLSQADAASTTIEIPNIGPVPLTALLPGTSACGLHDDRDVGLDGITVGWWFHLNFTAEEVTYTGP